MQFAERVGGHQREVGEPATVRVAVVGCGYWGAKHLRVLSSLPHVEEVVVEPSQLIRSRLRKSFPDLPMYDSLDAALVDGLDGAVLATPVSTHFDLAKTLLSTGVDVLVEKPLATSSLQARELLRIARDRGRVLMVGHLFEYNSAVRYLRTAVQQDLLGNLFYLDSARLNLGLYQSDTNVLWDLAVHDVSIANYVLGSVPASVSAWGLKNAHKALEDVAYLRLQYEAPDVCAHIHVSWLDPAKVRRVTVVGSQRMAVYNDLNAEEPVRLYDKGVEMLPSDLSTPPINYRYGDIVSPRIPAEEPLMVEDAHFVDCVRTRSRSLTDGVNGAAVVAVLAAAEESLRTGREVAVTFDPLEIDEACVA